MRKLDIASKPTSQQLTTNHTHEVIYPAAGVNVIIRCYSAEAALREWSWQQKQGHVVTVKAVGA